MLDKFTKSQKFITFTLQRLAATCLFDAALDPDDAWGSESEVGDILRYFERATTLYGKRRDLLYILTILGHRQNGGDESNLPDPWDGY